MQIFQGAIRPSVLAIENADLELEFSQARIIRITKGLYKKTRLSYAIVNRNRFPGNDCHQK